MYGTDGVTYKLTISLNLDKLKTVLSGRVGKEEVVG